MKRTCPQSNSNPSFNVQPRVLFQKSTSPRNPTTTKLYDCYLHTQEPPQPLLKRLCTSPATPVSHTLLPTDIWAHILFHSTFETLLSLRSVSQTLRLASITTTRDFHSPLAAKATIFFHHNQLPIITPSEIDSFAQALTEINIITSLSDFLSSWPILESIQENKLKIILKFNSKEEIESLNTSLLQQSDNKFFCKIKELNFQKIEFNGTGFINKLLETISKNLFFFPSLQNLTIINENTGSSLHTPRIPKSLNILKKLSINNICQNTWLSDSLSGLTNLTIGEINGDNSIRAFQNVGQRIEVRLPSVLHYLTILSIGSVGSNATIKLPNFLPNLLYLIIEHLTFKIAVIQLPDLPSLTSLSIKRVEPKAKINFPSHLPCLTHVFLNGQKAVLELPDSKDGLKRFTIKNIQNKATQQILDAINVRINGMVDTLAPKPRNKPTTITANLRDTIKADVNSGQSMNAVSKQRKISHIVVAKIMKGSYDHLS